MIVLLELSSTVIHSAPLSLLLCFTRLRSHNYGSPPTTILEPSYLFLEKKKVINHVNLGIRNQEFYPFTYWTTPHILHKS